MDIFYQGNIILSDVVVTVSAQHEQELMKSDYVQLSWDDAVRHVLPSDAYVILDDVRYSLLEPYIPEEKGIDRYHYEPHFQHPVMGLGKITFKRDTLDSDGNAITLLDWSYAGTLRTLLMYFVEQIDKELALSGSERFGYSIVGEDIGDTVSVTFSTMDILSALASVANTMECEYHIDWHSKTLYFGHVVIERDVYNTPVLEVGVNVGEATVRNSKEGFWNAFEPQGSSRNITRRAASGENVQSNVRLALDKTEYPDGIIYTDDDGGIMTKDDFEKSGRKAFVKPLIFDTVYPKLDLYAYDIRCRVRYLVDDSTKEKVIDHYDGDKPVYKRYAVWFMRLAYPIYNDDKTVREWRDYPIKTGTGFATVETMKANYATSGYHYAVFLLDMDFNAVYFTDRSESYPGVSNPNYIIRISANGITVRGYVTKDYDSDRCYVYCEHTADGSDDRDETDVDAMNAFSEAIKQGDKVVFVSGVNISYLPDDHREGLTQVIDGKTLMGAFQPNKNEGAMTTPLAGRGDGENGYYGFELRYRTEDETIPEDKDAGDTGVQVKAGDYEIILQKKDDYILPTLESQGLVPKGPSKPSLTGNIVNLYNIVMDDTAEESARNDLKNETLKYIRNQFVDNNSYSFKAYETVFGVPDPETLLPRNPHLFIGQRVIYKNGEYSLDTRVMRLVTKIDYSFSQEITVGNEVIKGSQQTLKEQVQTILSGGSSSGGGGGVSEGMVRSIVESWVTPRFLSKVSDDTASGRIGFLKGLWLGARAAFGITEGGNATLNDISGHDATLTGTLRAVTGYFTSLFGNLLQSGNYTGDGIADTGFRLTADDGTGSSKLTVDNLYIRKKATFEELEVKKETAVAGNEIRSCAANIINRTDYLDENNNLLGYSYTKVPWLLNGVPFLLNGIFFGRQRQTRMMMSDTDVAKISVIRCYFLAKDGEREVDNMWKADNENGHDLVRCQTMNLVNSKRQTFISSVSESKAGNVFWWRKAVRVSSSPVPLDDGKEYHWIDVSMKDCAQGSDIPAAGDHIVQFGNDTNPERMNLIAQEINGGDAPSIKAYSGIYTYNLEKCWWGGSPRKMMLSPRKGYEFYGPSFKFVQEYGQEPAAMERGAWTDITPEADDATGNMVRKCYYYDKVSHQGCYWLCIFSGGAHWVAEETFTYNNVTYTKGRTIADDKYSALDTAHKELCTRKEDYTTDEPSTASLSWKKIVDRGTSVKSVVTAYAKQDPKDYNGTAPANGWESTIAALGTIDEGWYVWTRSITTYSDTLDDTTTYSVTRWGIDGDGIDDIETKFYESASMLSQNQLKALTESDWKEYNELPLNQGDYIYTRTKITYDKGGPSTVSYSVNRIGQDGVSYLTTEEYYCLGDSRTTPPSGHPYTRNDGKPQKIEASALKITGAWSESRPTYDTSSAAGRAKKYLWNFEVGYDTTTIVQVTQPMCIANYEKGIASIIETYAISAYSVAPQAGGYPSDITSWTDEAHDCAPTDEKPYQWNKTVTTYSDGSSDTFYHVSGVKGTHGTNITKSGVDTYRYAVSSQGTDSSKVTGWSTSKPSSWAQNEFLWTETTMHWSDGSTTVLYSSERNPNDGKPGQDVVTGTTTITYCVSDTNQQPADSQFKPYAQIVSQIQQGKWLWSKATTPYYKGSVSEANYLNSSSNYNVSYIATNGKSVTYDAANSSISYAISSYGVAGSGRDYPSDITAWSNTVPEPQNGKYLWTRDITAYNDGGTIKTTTSYGVSYYGKDGDSVEIDTTRTFVRYSSQKTEARPADNTFTLTEPPALGQGDYLWILSQTAYVGVADPLKSYSVSRVGTDGDKGDPGADGYTTHFAYATLQPGQTLPANGKVTQQNYQTYFGSTFSTTNFSGATVIGTYRQKNEKDGSTDADSQNAWEYTWTQWKGDGITIDSGNTFIRYAKAATQPALNKDDTNVWKTAISALSPSAGDTIWTWVHTAYSDGNYTDVCNPSYYGTNGNTPTITNGYWYINGSNTGVKAEGSDGDTPYIGSNGNWWIGTTDTKVQAEAQSALHCDLSNMMDGVAMTSEGKVTARQQIVTTLAIYYGMDVQTLTNLTWSALPTGITASRSGGTVTFTIDKDTQLTNDKAEITLTGTTAKGSMSALFTIQGFRAGGNGTSPVIFQLLPSENEIKKSKTGTYTPTTLTCSVTKRDGNNAPVAYTGSEVTIKMSVDNGTEQGYAAITTNNTKPNIGVTYKLYQGTTLIDVETVPVVVDGENGVGSRIVTLPVKYMNTGNTETSGNQPTEAYSNSKWKDSIAATNPSVGDYIWSIYGVTPYTIDKNGNETVGTTVYSYGVNRVGTDGNSAYSMHTAYAETAPNAPSGTGVTGFSTTMTPNSKFIGICVRQQQSGTGMDDDPTDPTAYEWAKFEGPQGANGRAMTGSSEHYKASSLATGETKPTSDAQEWTTNPNVPDESGNTQWNESKKYLWNYERIEYTESDGTVTVERTAPHVIAIWTKDGAEGRGIDSIVNYYAINNDPDNAPTTGWEDDPMAPTTDSPYLWNYERICWTKGTPAYTDTAPHVIGSKGEKMTFDDLTQAEKDSLKGADGYTVTCEPASLVINQNDGGSYDISSATPAYFKPRVTKGSGTTNLVTAVSVSRNYCVKDGSVNIVNTDPWTSANGLPVTGVYSTAITNKYTQGYLVLSVTADGKAFSITIPIAVNYLGTYIETIVDGKKTTIAQETKTMIEQDNFVVKTATYNEEKSAWQDAASWVSSVNTPAATVANYNQRITNAEENISTVTRKVDNISNANLLTGLADGEGWTHDESSFNAGKVEFHPAYISRQGSVPYQLISADVVLPAGRYTLSAESWSGGSQLLFIIQEFNNDEEDPDYDDYSDVTVDAGEQPVLTFNISREKRMRMMCLSMESTFTVTKPKLECGEVATAYSTEGDVTQSRIRQTADEIELKVNNTGINVNDGTIDLAAEKVTFSYEENGEKKSDKIWIDPATGTLRAVDGVFTGSLLYHKVIRYVTTTPNMDTEELFTYQSVPDAEQGRSVLSSFSLKCDICIISGKAISSYESRSTDHQWFGFELWLPPASMFPGASMRIINGTYGENSTKWYGSPSVITLRVFHNQDTEEAHEDGDFVTDEFGKQMAILKNAFAVAAPFKYWRLVNNTEIENNLYRYYTKLVFKNYDSIELVSTENPYLQQGSGEYVWLVIDTKEHELNNEEI